MSESSYIDRPNRPLHVYALGYIAFLYIPILFIPLFSFNDNIYVAFPLKGFTTQWYEAMITDSPDVDRVVEHPQSGNHLLLYRYHLWSVRGQSAHPL